MYRKQSRIFILLLAILVFLAGIETLTDSGKAEAAKKTSKYTRIKDARKNESPARKPRPKANGKGKIRVVCPYQKTKKYKYSGYLLKRAGSKKGKYKTIRSFKKNKKRTVTDKKSRLGRGYWYKITPYWETKGKRIYGKSSQPAYAKNKLRYSKKMRVKAYAYTGHGTTASGKRAKRGRIAVDPKVIKLGSYVWVQDYGLAEAADTGGMIKGKTVDLYMNSKKEVYNWGVRYKNLYILE